MSDNHKIWKYYTVNIDDESLKCNDCVNYHYAANILISTLKNFQQIINEETLAEDEEDFTDIENSESIIEDDNVIKYTVKKNSEPIIFPCETPIDRIRVEGDREFTATFRRNSVTVKGEQCTIFLKKE
ncbi:790_t:CDS:2 [Scutellospora calospora]|uniref:790_t:CDS:1 n=1 Tax=Scutellospora calospora TaxID=85575 RepID=A0ACA9JWT1_9GLOM|nr:790_t:CDS:2 [Scutellospora calospora]